jgi:hypothetical protein
MLITKSEGDYQVTHDDFSPWQAAFAHDKQVKVAEYPAGSPLLARQQSAVAG